MSYMQKHKNLFFKSFKLDDLTFKLFITDVLFILTILAAYDLIYLFWLKNLVSISGLLGIDSFYGSTLSTIDVAGAVKVFLIKLMIIIFIALLAYILFLSLYGAISHTFMNKKPLSWKLFLNFLCMNSILTFGYILFIAIMFMLIDNALAIATIALLLMIIYLYAMFIFYLVISDGKLSKVMHHGWKSMIRLHDTMPPFMLSFLIVFFISLIVAFVFQGSPLAIGIILLLVSLYMLTWMRKYLHHIIHE